MKVDNVTMSIEELLEFRVMICWAAGTKEVDYAIFPHNWVEDYSARFTKTFTFMGQKGWIDQYDYVGWGNMGFHLDMAKPKLRQAIRDQTGY